MSMTNAEFAKHDGVFKEACELAEIPVTARQASKYRRGIGKAFQFKTEVSRRRNDAI